MSHSMYHWSRKHSDLNLEDYLLYLYTHFNCEYSFDSKNEESVPGERVKGKIYEELLTS